MFDGSLPEIGDLAALDDAALVDAAAGWARTENAACARKTTVMAELFARRTGLPAGERADWWVDPEAAVGAELGATQNISPWMALAQAHRGVVLADRGDRNEPCLSALVREQDRIRIGKGYQTAHFNCHGVSLVGHAVGGDFDDFDCPRCVEGGPHWEIIQKAAKAETLLVRAYTYRHW